MGEEQLKHSFKPVGRRFFGRCPKLLFSNIVVVT